jgi:hypothetical protein
MMKKIANVLRLFCGCVFAAGVVINIAIGIIDPTLYNNGGLHAWPDFLQSFWASTVVPNMIWFIVLYAVIEAVLAYLILNKGSKAKLGLVGGAIFGAGLLILGLGAERGDWLARIPNLAFEAMMVYCLFFDYEKTFIETVRRKKEVITSVIGS